jgi:4-hydroxybenzoate polyprenyltransferase
MTSSVVTFARAIRLHHWVKNLLIFLPLLLAHRFLEIDRLLHAGYAFLSFSLCASSVYLLNDVLDLDSDREHPVKRHRPIASGLLNATHALLFAGLFAIVGLLIAWFLLSTRFIQLLLVYLLATTAYSWRLKGIAILDVMVLASLYTVRVFAGSVAVDVLISPWFLAFCVFFFLNLAFLKRYTELLLVQAREGDRALGRSYRVTDLTMFQIVGPVSGYLSVLIFALYVTSDVVADQYNRPNALWLACGFLLYWITHTWFIANRGEMHDDPVLYALRDPYSYLAVVGMSMVMVLAALV